MKLKEICCLSLFVILFLDFLITAHIFEKCGNLNPGQLTDLRSALVNNITFACLAVRYGFYKFLNAGSPALLEAIDRFVQFQEGRNHVIDEEVSIKLMVYVVQNKSLFYSFNFV